MFYWSLWLREVDAFSDINSLTFSACDIGLWDYLYFSGEFFFHSPGCGHDISLFLMMFNFLWFLGLWLEFMDGDYYSEDVLFRIGGHFGIFVLDILFVCDGVVEL